MTGTGFAPNRAGGKIGRKGVFYKYIATATGILFALFTASMCWAIDGAVEKEIQYLKKLSLKALLELEVTSVSKKPEKISDAATAVFVITNEDIRRSGATSIPGLLRLVPGLQVARIDSNKWAITSRGFNGRFANKLLVLIDGRSVYTPFYSGVFWDVQDTLLEDVERIEVIRGPGATLWGANAVNGVINIITKRADKTLGGLLSVGAGTEERGFGSARFGGKIGEKACFRVYAKYFNRDESVYASGDKADDDWGVTRAGFRIDWDRTDQDLLTLQGDIYDGETGQEITFHPLTAPYSQTFDEDAQISGGNILFRWNRARSNTSDLTLQIYYDKTRHKEKAGDLNHDTVDIDFQHRFSLTGTQNLIWGINLRYVHDDNKELLNVSIDPQSRNDQIYSSFIQDDITLIKDRLRLTVGSKFEYNDYTGFEIQPNIRMLWIPDEQYSIWASIARAVRTPSRVEHDAQLITNVIPPATPANPFPVPVAMLLTGERDVDSEDLIAYELGFRARPSDQFSVDISTFYNIYDNLLSVDLGTPVFQTPPLHISLPLIPDNKMKGETYGIEIAADWRMLEWWRVRTAYTFLKMQLHLKNDFSETTKEASPRHQISIRSSMDLPWHLELDLWGRYTDNLPAQEVGSYVSLDARLAWKMRKDLELSIVGQNLLDSHHPEFMPELLKVTPTEMERRIYGRITWYF